MLKFKQYLILEESSTSLTNRELEVDNYSTGNNTNSSANLMMPNQPPPSWWGGRNRLQGYFDGEPLPDWFRRIFGISDDFDDMFPPAGRDRIDPRDRGVEIEAPHSPGSRYKHRPDVNLKPGGQWNGWLTPPREFPVHSHQAAAHNILGLDRSRYLTVWEGNELPQGVFIDSQPPHLLWTLGAPAPGWPQGVPYWLDDSGDFGQPGFGIWHMVNPNNPGSMNPWGIKPPGQQGNN